MTKLILKTGIDCVLASDHGFKSIKLYNCSSALILWIHSPVDKGIQPSLIPGLKNPDSECTKCRDGVGWKPTHLTVLCRTVSSPLEKKGQQLCQLTDRKHSCGQQNGY